MKVLSVLIIAFALTVGISRLASGSWNFVFGGNLAMFLMLCLTAVGHYKFAEGMAMMIPDPIPFGKEIVFWSGITEVLLGLGLLFPATRTPAGIALLLLFVLLLPGNIHAALRHIDFEKANHEGPGPAYLWFRIPMQVLLMAWVYWFSIRK
ncbi:DoxX family protein [Taibaiella koreensis]|uniref:DoxX family protein n=1 Tax=Taibaiella koreensis TaxID=1268548 RepID=UPI0013C2E4A6|nr:hypothetical protein [Taibaiella koreensis]